MDLPAAAPLPARPRTWLAAVAGPLFFGLLLLTAPAAAAAPSTVPSAVTARAGDSLVDLGWTGGGTAGVLVRALEGSAPPASPTDGREVYRGTADGVRDPALVDGTTYSYALWALDLDGTTGPAPATVTTTPVAASDVQLTLTAPAPRVDTGTAITLLGRLQRPDGAVLPGETVTVLARTMGTSAVTTLASLTTAADGGVSLRVTPRVSADYALRFAGSPFGLATDSATYGARVRPAVSASLSPASIVQGSASVLRGVVTPAYAGVRVAVQRLAPEGWRTVSTVGTAAGGGYAAPLRPGVGTSLLRVAVVGTAAYETGLSPAVRLTVDPRNLALGDSGPDVLALEQQLTAQHFFQNAPDGVFGEDTFHALTAFQKSQGLPRTGYYDPMTRARLAGAQPLAVRVPAAGVSVEVDISRQILKVSRDGSLIGVLDTSTGSDRPYVSDGVGYIANTPRGSFRVTWKYDGIRISRLGQLYRPAFFVQGWAIHGSPSVPVYPASHGCVRVTNTAMDWLYPLLSTGAPVTVYDS